MGNLNIRDFVTQLGCSFRLSSKISWFDIFDMKNTLEQQSLSRVYYRVINTGVFLLLVEKSRIEEVQISKSLAGIQIKQLLFIVIAIAYCKFPK